MSDKHATQPENTGCPECGCPDDWHGASWCPNCGYYPAISQQILAEPHVEEEPEFENWWDVVPDWLRVMSAGIGAMFVVSIAVRVMFEDSPIRMLWTIAQMAIGVITLGVAHVMAYFYGVGRSDKLGPLDMFVKPLVTWQPVLRDLPASSNLVNAMGCSIAALVFGFFIVDGVDYVAIMHRDVEERKLAEAEQAAKDAAEGKRKKSAMAYLLQGATTAAQAHQAMGPTPVGPPPASLEEALAEFTGEDPMVGGGVGSSPRNMGSQRLGGPMIDFTDDGRIDVDAFMQHQQAIANGFGAGSAPGGVTGTLTGGQTHLQNTDRDSDRPGSTSNGASTGIRRPPNRGVSKSNGRNARLPATDARSATSPVSTPADASSGGVETEPIDTEDSEDLSMEVECLVLGYTTNHSGDIRSLLLAAAPDRELLRFVAKVPIEDVNGDVLAQMTARFPKIPDRQSLVRCPYGGNWVKPVIFCVTQYDGWTTDRRLNRPRVVSLINPDQP